jgi:hypothetical protein
MQNLPIFDIGTATASIYVSTVCIKVDQIQLLEADILKTGKYKIRLQNLSTNIFMTPGLLVLNM